MGAIEPNWTALLWFCLFWTASCIAFLSVSGMFPLGSRPEEAKGAGGISLIVGNAMLLLALAVGTAFYGYAELRWTSLVVAGGLIFLFAPDAFQVWPARLRDGRVGLAAVLVLQTCALLGLYAVGGPALSDLTS